MNCELLPKGPLFCSGFGATASQRLAKASILSLCLFDSLLCCVKLCFELARTLLRSAEFIAKPSNLPLGILSSRRCPLIAAAGCCLRVLQISLSLSQLGSQSGLGTLETLLFPPHGPEARSFRHEALTEVLDLIAEPGLSLHGLSALLGQQSLDPLYTSRRFVF